MFMDNKFVMKRSGDTSSYANKLDRKTIEKIRRIRMKALCLKLVSLIPDRHFNPAKEFLSQQDQIEQAAGYVKLLSERMEELRRKKAELVKQDDLFADGSNLPVFKIRDYGSDLEVTLISDLRKRFKLHKVIQILEQEGAEVFTASTSRNGDKIFQSLSAKIKVLRVGVDTSRICEKIGELVSYSL